MISIQQITIARKNWEKAAADFKFKIITPYLLSTIDKEIFAFLPEYGSLNGTVIELISAPEFETDKKIEKWAIENGCFYSFINIESVLNYSQQYFEEILSDWMRYKNL